MSAKVSSIGLGPLLKSSGIKKDQTGVGVLLGWDLMGQSEQQELACSDSG